AWFALDPSKGHDGGETGGTPADSSNQSASVAPRMGTSGVLVQIQPSQTSSTFLFVCVTRRRAASSLWDCETPNIRTDSARCRSWNSMRGWSGTGWRDFALCRGWVPLVHA